MEFTAMELKDTRPALLDNDELEEKRRPHGHNTSGRGKKLWPPF
jgi:hypothetical protein